MAEWRVDPETYKFSEEGRPRPGGYTWEEFMEVERPPCPQCGMPMEVDAVGPARTFGASEPRYVPGRFRCPNGCQRPTRSGTG
jgi:hypothetical protein